MLLNVTQSYWGRATRCFCLKRETLEQQGAEPNEGYTSALVRMGTFCAFTQVSAGRAECHSGWPQISRINEHSGKSNCAQAATQYFKNSSASAHA